MTRHDETVWCDGCGVEIAWPPVGVNERDYCCLACLTGLPCACGERLEAEEERRASELTGAET
jgi:hypothetical protein